MSRYDEYVNPGVFLNGFVHEIMTPLEGMLSQQKYAKLFWLTRFRQSAESTKDI
ncbi:MAG: hypothetical protein Q8R06_22090 [Polaromonas sp.]|nr:hypothetical protein [Polaromonas sp.]